MYTVYLLKYIKKYKNILETSFSTYGIFILEKKPGPGKGAKGAE